MDQDATLHCMLLERNLLYTATMWSKKLLVVVGQMKALAMALERVGYEKTVLVIDSHTMSERRST